MATKNENSTRFYSDKQEKYVAKLLNGVQTSNSGAGIFDKTDVVVKSASLAIECKTTIASKESFSIKKEWIEKLYQEGASKRLSNVSLVFNFEPNGKNYFIIDEKLMKFLVEKLEIAIN